MHITDSITYNLIRQILLIQVNMHHQGNNVGNFSPRNSPFPYCFLLAFYEALRSELSWSMDWNKWLRVSELMLRIIRLWEMFHEDVVALTT